MKVFLFWTFALLLFSAAPSAAEERYQCGIPDNPRLDKTDDPEYWRYCDIYARRFAYVEEQKEFREELNARRENYMSYREGAYQNYKDELDLYYLLMD